MVREARRLYVSLATRGVEVREARPNGAVSIQATYDPVSESGIISLYGLDDAHLPESVL